MNNIKVHNAPSKSIDHFGVCDNLMDLCSIRVGQVSDWMQIDWVHIRFDIFVDWGLLVCIRSKIYKIWPGQMPIGFRPCMRIFVGFSGVCLFRQIFGYFCRVYGLHCKIADFLT